MQAITHDSFVIERTYQASPEQVFAAWADPAIKARWFIGPEGWTEIRREVDFRVGGEELLHGRFETRDTLYKARYYEIVAAQRIVFVYDMHLSGKHHSVSLASVEFRPAASGTKLVFTEAVAFLDGTKSAEGRKHGTAAHLDRIAQQVDRSTARVCSA
jgi:uncharacterized protein YndB with AHSA1/START domain